MVWEEIRIQAMYHTINTIIMYLIYLGICIPSIRRIKTLLDYHLVLIRLGFKRRRKTSALQDGVVNIPKIPYFPLLNESTLTLIIEIDQLNPFIAFFIALAVSTASASVKNGETSMPKTWLEAHSAFGSGLYSTFFP